MSHLGGRLSALIDGELSDTERDQVHAHLVGCDACREEAAALRTLKRRVRGLAETPADGELTRRLIALGGLPSPAGPPRRPGSDRARAALAAFSGGPAAVPPGWSDVRDWFEDGAAREDAGSLPGSARGRGHARYVVAGAVAALAVSLGAASFAAGGNEQAPGPTVRPEVDVFMMEHAVTSGLIPPPQPGTPRPRTGLPAGQLSFPARP
jgi:anti-sigma factor RsiW